MNNLPKFILNDLILIRAKPNSSKSVLEWDCDLGRVNAYLRSVPDNNKANDELVKLFKKQLRVRVEIVSGFKSRDKKVKVL